MPSSTFHHEHIKAQLQREIGWTIKNRVRDPRVPEIVTVTGIKLASDLRNATVYVSVYGDEKIRTGALVALNRAAPFVQRTVSRRISIRHFPKLIFRLDDSVDRSLHIAELLREVQDDLV